MPPSSWSPRAEVACSKGHRSMAACAGWQRFGIRQATPSAWSNSAHGGSECGSIHTRPRETISTWASRSRAMQPDGLEAVRAFVEEHWPARLKRLKRLAEVKARNKPGR